MEPSALTFETNTSGHEKVLGEKPQMPPKDAWMAFAMGKLLEIVNSVTWTLPIASTASVSLRSPLLPPQEGGIHQRGAGGVQLGDEGIRVQELSVKIAGAVASARCIRSSSGDGECVRVGVSRHESIPGVIDGDPLADVILVAPEEGRIGKRGACGIEGRNENVLIPVVSFVEGAGRRREAAAGRARSVRPVK